MFIVSVSKLFVFLVHRNHSFLFCRYLVGLALNEDVERILFGFGREIVGAVKQRNDWVDNFDQLCFVLIETKIDHNFNGVQNLQSEHVLIIFISSLNTINIQEEVDGKFLKGQELWVDLDPRLNQVSFCFFNFLPYSSQNRNVDWLVRFFIDVQRNQDFAHVSSEFARNFGIHEAVQSKVNSVHNLQRKNTFVVSLDAHE